VFFILVETMVVRRQENSVSLFPFLAVLICAMGALILLLLVTTRQIRKTRGRQLDQEVVQASGPAIPDPSIELHAKATVELQSLHDAVAETEKQIGMLVEQTEFQQQELQRRTARVAELQAAVDSQSESLDAADVDESKQALNDATADLELLAAEVEELNSKLTDQKGELHQLSAMLASSEEEAEQQKVALRLARSGLVLLRADVVAAQERQREAIGGATVVEFSNPSGTSRRPILVDVTDKGFNLLSSGVRISARDMDGTSVRNNPLLSAVLTAHRFRSGDSAFEEPYVLMLVRPSGSTAFYMAQRIFTDAKVHFGYELLNEQRRIATGTIDKQETRAVRDAVLYAIQNTSRTSAARRSWRDRGTRPRAGSPSPSVSPSRNTRGVVLRPDGRVVVQKDTVAGGLSPRSSAGGFPRSVDKASEPGGPRERGRPFGSTDPLDSTFERLLGANGRENAAATSDVSSIPSPASAINNYGNVERPRADFGGSAVPRSTGDRLTAGQPTGQVQQPRTADVDSAPTALPGELRNEARDSRAAVERGWKPSQRRTADASTQSPGSAGGSQFGSDVANQPDWMKPPASLADMASPATESIPSPMAQFDAELLKQLAKRNRDPGNDRSRPVGITVFVDQQHMTVSQRDAIFVTRDGEGKAVGELFEGINEAVTVARQHPLDPVLPIVKFVVSPGGERLRSRLSQHLLQSGIPFVNVVSIEPYIMPVSGLATFSTEPPARAPTDGSDVLDTTTDIRVKSTGMERALP
jgi:hypothetical protein